MQGSCCDVNHANFNQGAETGKASEFVASHLSGIKVLKFPVKERSVRDRTKLLLESYELKLKVKKSLQGLTFNKPS